jgi:hypothetical protein
MFGNLGRGGGGGGSDGAWVQGTSAEMRTQKIPRVFSLPFDEPCAMGHWGALYGVVGDLPPTPPLATSSYAPLNVSSRPYLTFVPERLTPLAVGC